MSPVPEFKLNTGATAPAIGTIKLRHDVFGSHCSFALIGLGCFASFKKEGQEKSKEWILSALKVATMHSSPPVQYSTCTRLVTDVWIQLQFMVSYVIILLASFPLTADILGTEKFVGQAIKESGIPREELFITTKLSSALYTGRTRI